jgi:hypothetical protein
MVGAPGFFFVRLALPAKVTRRTNKVLLKFFNKQLSKRCHVGMSQTVIFMIIRLVTLSVNIFLM